MDFVDALAVLARRWLVVLTGALLTAGAGLYAIEVVPTNYQARAQYVLLLPAGAPGGDAINPFLNLNGGLSFAASLIASDVGTPVVAREMVASGFDSQFTIGQSNASGPLLDVSVTGSDHEDVLATRDELLRRFDSELKALQEIPGIPAYQRIFSRTNAVDPVAEAVPGAKKRALLLIATVGGVLTLVLAFALDGWLRRRQERRRALKQKALEATQPAAPQPLRPSRTAGGR